MTIAPQLAWSAYAPPNTFVSVSGHMYLYLTPTVGHPLDYTYVWDANPYMNANWGYVIRAYPSAPTWFKVTITRKSDNCQIRDSIFIDYLDIRCGNMFYSLCNTTTNVSTCVKGFPQTDALLKSGNYALGTCTPKASGLSGESAMRIEVFPNPNNGEFTVNVSGNGTLEIFDMSSKRLIFESVQSVEGMYTQSYDLRGLSPRVYYIQVRDEREIVTTKVVIRH